MKKTLLKSLQVLVILSLFFAVGCKKEKDEKQKDVGVEINGVIWATRNVDKPGTFVAKPENAGMLYQWNRKVGWSSTEPLVNHEGGSTWNPDTPTGDSWEKTNDPCPSGWRVPTLEEQQSLVAANKEWTTLNGVTGRYFGSDKNLVFFPAVGYCGGDDGLLYNVGDYGLYWSSTPSQGNSTFAYGMNFHSENTYSGNNYRRSGFSVRCVKEQ